MIRVLLIAFILGVGATRSFAQTNQAKPPQPVGSEPESTAATYGVWTLRCFHKQGGTEKRLCEVEQSVVPQGQQNPIARLAIDRPSGKGEFRIITILPPNITFQFSPKVTAQEKDPGVQLTWRRCLPGGCIADANLKDETLRAWHAIAADTGRLYFTNAAGQNVAIEFSLRGFGQAMDAFAKARS